MPVQLLPALGMGAKVLLGGATIGGTALGAASLYDSASGMGKGFRDKAYAAGPDAETGKFSAGFLGNQFINEDSESFLQGYKNYAIRNNQALQTMSGVLGDKLEFDPTKTIAQNVELNRTNFNTENAKQQVELSKLTPEYQERQDDRDFLKQQYLDQRLDAQQQRLDLLNQQRMQYAREDQRYNEARERDQRTRDQQIIMAMMGGLTNLGGMIA